MKWTEIEERLEAERDKIHVSPGLEKRTWKRIDEEQKPVRRVRGWQSAGKGNEIPFEEEEEFLEEKPPKIGRVVVEILVSIAAVLAILVPMIGRHAGDIFISQPEAIYEEDPLAGNEEKPDDPETASPSETETVLPTKAELSQESERVKHDVYIVDTKVLSYQYEDLFNTSYYLDGDGKLNGVLGVIGDTVYFRASEQGIYDGAIGAKNLLCAGNLSAGGGPVRVVCETESAGYSQYIGVVKDSIYILQDSNTEVNHWALWRYDAEGNGYIALDFEAAMMPAAYPCGDRVIIRYRVDDRCEVGMYDPFDDHFAVLLQTGLVYDSESGLYTGEYISCGGSTSGEGFVYGILKLEGETLTSQTSPENVYYYDLKEGEQRFLFTAEGKLADLTGDKDIQLQVEAAKGLMSPYPLRITETEGISQRLLDEDLSGAVRIRGTYRQDEMYIVCLNQAVLLIDAETREITKYNISIPDVPMDDMVPVPVSISFSLAGEKGEWLCFSFKNRVAVVPMGYKRAVLTMAAEDSVRGENLSEAKLDILQKYTEYLLNGENTSTSVVIEEKVQAAYRSAENATGEYEIAGVLWDDEYRFVVRLIEWRSIGDGEYSIEHTVDIIKQDGSWTVQQDIISSIDPWKEDYVNQLTTLSEDLRNLKRLVNPLREADIRAAMDAAKEAQMDPVFTGLMTEAEKELFRQNLTAVYAEEWEDKHVDVYAMRKDHRNHILLIWVQYTGEEGLIREEVIRGIYGTDGINGYPFVVVQDGDTWSARHEGSIPDPEPPEGGELDLAHERSA